MTAASKLRRVLANMGAYLDREPVDPALLREVHGELEEAAFAVLALMEPPKVVADRNIALAGLQTIRGVPLERGDVVLATAQEKPVQNGLWVVSAVAWSRPGTDAERERAEGRLFGGGAVCFERDAAPVADGVPRIVAQFSNAEPKLQRFLQKAAKKYPAKSDPVTDAIASESLSGPADVAEADGQGGASPPARVLRPVPGSLRGVDATGRAVPATLHEKPDGSIDVAVVAQHGEHARIFWDVEGLTPDDLAEIEGRAQALGFRGGDEGQLLEDLARVVAALKGAWKTCGNAAPEDVPGDVPTITAVAPEHLPAGSKGAHLWVMRENGRETALLALEPGGVLGEDAHDKREIVRAVRGRVLLHFEDGAIELDSGLSAPLACGERHRLEAGPGGAFVAMWWAP